MNFRDFRGKAWKLDCSWLLRSLGDELFGGKVANFASPLASESGGRYRSRRLFSRSLHGDWLLILKYTLTEPI